MKNMTSNKYDHRSVLKNEILENIRKHAEINVFCDCTVGEGGHIEFLKDKLDNWTFIGIDRDKKILKRTKERLGDSILLFNDSYANIRRYFDKDIGVFLLDLGLSMYHIKSSERGFSWQMPEEPLDMRFSTNTKKTAAYILNNYPQKDLNRIFEEYGDIINPEKITKSIILFRKKNKFKIIKDLFDAIAIEEPSHFRKFLSKLFQALRIEVNNELEQLRSFLQNMDGIKNKSALFMFISYHSGEDKILKNTIRELKIQSKIVIINKHVIKPSYKEIKANKAARSAKMRIIKYL
ncbi:16S rRNA (cytosine(1402)-N(4))-methyltransferase RsmH [bacterium]|nr:16S rRNA (cytosine(1402)-N(4))-methyltransferase RsmH [bacterium]